MKKFHVQVQEQNSKVKQSLYEEIPVHVHSHQQHDQTFYHVIFIMFYDKYVPRVNH